MEIKFSEFIKEATDPYTLVSKAMTSIVGKGIVTFLDDNLEKDGKGVTLVKVLDNDIWYADADKANGKRVVKYNFEESQW